jgi:hypothetical protein
MVSLHLVDGFDKAGIAFGSDQSERRARSAEGIPRDRVAIAPSVKDEDPAAGVAGGIAAAASEQPAAFCHRHLDSYSVLAKKGDLCVLVDAGHEEASHRKAQSSQAQGDDQACGPAAVDRDGSPSQSRERLSRHVDRTASRCLLSR